MRRRLRIARQLAAVRVTVREPMLTALSAVDVRAEIELAEGAEVKDVRVGLVCESKSRDQKGDVRKTRFAQHWETPRGEALKRVGRRLTCQVRLSPSPFVPSTPSGTVPHYRWRVEIAATITEGKEALAEFPLRAVR